MSAIGLLAEAVDEYQVMQSLAIAVIEKFGGTVVLTPGDFAHAQGLRLLSTQAENDQGVLIQTVPAGEAPESDAEGA